MFNLLVKSTGWAEGSDRMPAGRLFEYTDDNVADQFRADGRPNFKG